jgi:probable H4MPT-linked C1 transfer pathway protein
MVPTIVIGWDIGGAHVKAAMVDAGRLVAVRQWPCALWHGLDQLDAVFDDACRRWLPPAADTAGAIGHAVTMTGEMVDLFASRHDGVIRLVHHLRGRLGPRLRLFAGTGEWLGSEAAVDRWQALASANWAATARLVAASVGSEDALLVDIGSTTTDLVPILQGQVRARGSSDAERLRSGELLYQGVIRTPLCSLSRRIRFRGESFNVMNEWFATTADVYRLTGDLDAAHDQHPAADNGAKDVAGSCRRIARMIGHDADAAPLEDWQSFARRWRSLQPALLEAELQRVAPDRTPLLVAAGCGSFLVAELAQRRQCRQVAFAELAGAPPSLRRWADVCAPAVAVALLAADALDGFAAGFENDRRDDCRTESH